MKIAIVGSGYVGLVASACFAELGHDVICVDNDPEKLAALVRGETPIHEQYLPELLGRHRGQRLKFSASLPDAVRAGEVDEQLLDAAVKRVLLLKLRLGLFEQPYVDEARAGSQLGDPGHRELARIAAERSAVLLRNEGGVLPLPFGRTLRRGDRAVRG